LVCDEPTSRRRDRDTPLRRLILCLRFAKPGFDPRATSIRLQATSDNTLYVIIRFIAC
jgi:hypothetical protein